jgi:hypothetical protein
MPLRVECAAQFLSKNWTPAPPGDVYDAHRFVKTAKGTEHGKTIDVRLDGAPSVIYRDMQQPTALKLAAEWAIGRLARRFQTDGVIAVPVPGSKCALETETIGAADLFANTTAQFAPRKITVATAIRFALPMKSSRDGGPRWNHELFPHLRKACDVPGGRPVVLFDDVLTSGGHLTACRAFLAQMGVAADFALCIGRTNQVSCADPWSIAPVDFEDFVPDPF